MILRKDFDMILYDFEKNLVTMCWILSVTPKHPSIIPY